MHSAEGNQEASYAVRPVPQTEADSRRAEILALVHREPESRDLLGSILKADPNNALAMEVMGGIEYHTGNAEAARKWYGDALRLNPSSWLANYYYASISMHTGVGEPDPAIESSYRAAIDANPKFAPAYDGLASYYAMHQMKLDEAYKLEVTAIKLEPANPYFRMNTANVVSAMGRFDEALSILQAATRLARRPGELAMVQSRISQLKEFHEMQARADVQMHQIDSSQPQSNGPIVVAHVSDPKPRHPVEANGPKHSLFGVMRNVTCGYPTLLEMRVEGTGGKSVNLYSNDFSKINLTVVGFSPEGPMNPCKDFDGLKARVQYAEAADQSVDGQVLAIELHK
jgi:tetratricopeptide (TPR) repeat protein